LNLSIASPAFEISFFFKKSSLIGKLRRNGSPIKLKSAPILSGWKPEGLEPKNFPNK